MKKQIYLNLVLLMITTLLMSGCSKSSDANQDALGSVGPKDILFLDSKPQIECTDTHLSASGEFEFYDIAMTIQVRNDSDQKMTNKNIDSLNMEAGLLNVNGRGRADADFLVSRNGIEPGEYGQLYFYFNYITSYFEWKSFDVSINGSKIYDVPVSISGSLCL